MVLWMGAGPSHDTVVESYACHECVVMSLRSPVTKSLGVIPRGCGQGEERIKVSMKKMSTRKCKGGSPCERADFRSLGQKLRTAGKARTRKREDAWKKRETPGSDTVFSLFSARLEAGI